MTSRSLGSIRALLLALSLGGSACASSGEDDTGTAANELAAEQTFLVVYKNTAVPAGAAAVVSSAGGRLKASYPELGVVVATSASRTFAAKLAKHAAVEGVAPTRGVGINALPTKRPGRRLPRPPRPGTSAEPLAPLQWDMDQIHAGAARRITPGSKKVVVAVLDSGIDDTMPDLRGQVDHARSATCIDGVANTDESVWSFDEIGHGTHVAGLIAAKEDGVGIAGVAPGVTLAAVKLTEDGFIYPEAFVCGVYWAATHGASVINASLFTDPWYYNCPTDPAQRLLMKAQQRAVSFATSKGALIVAATGNEQQDLAHPTLDPFSPTNGDSLNRTIDSTCKVLPVGLDGVIGVSATGSDGKLAYYSNVGLGVVDLAAPGGDFHVGTAENPSGQIVSDAPAYSMYYQAAIDWNGRVAVGCSDGKDANDPASDPTTCKETYALLQGTSQATPHVSGIAALALSRFGAMSPAKLAAKLAAGAIPQACPSSPYQPYPEEMPAMTCEGTAKLNGFFGAGRADAYLTVR
jgi:lantibiotic leader peptide-processing serine protease